MLFNAWSTVPKHMHARIPGLRSCCWCWPCSGERFWHRCIAAHRADCEQNRAKTSRESRQLGSTFDPELRTLAQKDAGDDWNPDNFKHLWPRIARLEEHLKTSKPWGLRILFQDRRDTVQYWTFLYVHQFLSATKYIADSLQVCYNGCCPDCRASTSGRGSSGRRLQIEYRHNSRSVESVITVSQNFLCSRIRSKYNESRSIILVCLKGGQQMQQEAKTRRVYLFDLAR